MMPQGRLPFQYESEKNESSLTSFAGLPLYIEWIIATGLHTNIKQTLSTKSQGWSEVQIISSLILLNLAGGDCVDDIERLEFDAGLRTLMLKFDTHGMKRKERREYIRRWRKEKRRAFPSASVLRRELEKFHDPKQEELRKEGVAFIPEPNTLLQRLVSTNDTLIQFAQQKDIDTVTLDIDATLAQTHKRAALYCYKKFKAYQPVNVYWDEKKILLYSEFRDGNVPAKFELLRILKISLSKLPAGVSTVYLRSDSAGYQADLLQYCAEGLHEQFKKIEFVISANVTQGFKKEALALPEHAWSTVEKVDEQGQVIKTNQQWAEVCFVPDWAVKNKSSCHYRYIAIREKMQPLKKSQSTDDLSFQTVLIEAERYKLFAIVTNRSLPGNELIQWHRGRCGDSEKVHSIEKNELAGGQFPSNLFGANAAWWQIMVLTFNLNQLMKQWVLPDEFKLKGLKALRFHIIGVAGRLTKHARQFIIRLSGGLETLDLFSQIRAKIACLAVSVIDDG